jgi:hypothetical protein
MSNDHTKLEKALQAYLQRQLSAAKRTAPGTEAAQLRAGGIIAAQPIASAIVQPVAVARPANMHNPIVKSTGAVSIVKSTDVISRHWEPIFKDLKLKWVARELPYRKIDPAPALVNPVVAGDFTLWADAPRNLVFFALNSPRMSDFQLTIHHQGGRVINGTAVFNMTVYASEELKSLAKYRDEWTLRLEQAGHSHRNWKFLPLTLLNLQATVTLPKGYTVSPLKVATSADTASAAVIAELTANGALSWQSALEQGRPDQLQGNCSFTAQYYAQVGKNVNTRKHAFKSTLGRLAQAAGISRTNLRVVQLETSVTAKFVVVGDERADRVVINLSPSNDQAPVSHVFTGGGGTYSLTLNDPAPENLTIDWTALVEFNSTNWPIVRESGTMGGTKWGEMIKPDSWIQPVTLVVMLLDAAGDVLPASSNSAVDPNNHVFGEITFTASYLEDVSLLRTISALRGGRIDMKTRRLRPAETMLLVQVLHNGTITIETNSDPTPEKSLEENVFGMLGELQSTSPPVQLPETEVGGPTILGPATHPINSGPPIFEVVPSPNRFYVVEVTTQSELFDQANFGDLITWENFYASDWDEPFLSAPTYTLPTAVWDRLKRFGPLYYRIWTSASPEDWVDADVSTPDMLSFEAPFIEISSGTTTHMPSGKGMFTQVPLRRLESTPEAMAEKAQANELSWVAILSLWQYSNRTQEYNTPYTDRGGVVHDPLAEYIDELRLSNPDFGVYLWGYPHPERFDEFAERIIARAFEVGADGVIPDPELPWKWHSSPQETSMREAARRMMQGLIDRARERGLSVGITSYGKPDPGHSNFPWDEFAAADYGLPQIYDSDNSILSRDPLYPNKCIEGWRSHGFTQLIPISSAWNKTEAQMENLLNRTPTPNGAIAWYRWRLADASSRPYYWRIIREYALP